MNTILLRVENGVVKERVTRTEYNIFADELARRTYDESGDYYVKPFSVSARESLNDRIGNRGIYLDTQQTQNGNPRRRRNPTGSAASYLCW